MKYKPLFIVVEGGDGVGKGTQINLLENHLKDLGFDITKSREPGGSEVGEKIRDIIEVCGGSDELSSESELALFIAGRLQHAKEVIRPFVDSKEPNRALILDRYWFSTFAYQMVAGGLRDDGNIAEIFWSHVEWIQSQGLNPDLFLVFDLDPEKANERLDGRSGTKMGFDKKPLSFKSRVREGMLEAVSIDPRSKIIDARGTPEEIHENVLAVLAKYLKPL